MHRVYMFKIKIRFHFRAGHGHDTNSCPDGYHSMPSISVKVHLDWIFLESKSLSYIMFVQYINLSKGNCAGCIYETVSHHPPPPPPPAMRGRQSVGSLTFFRQKYLSFINIYVVYEDLLRQRGSWGNLMINRRKDYSIFIFLSPSPKKKEGF